MSLADYLAKNYLTADSAPKKSKKRKRKGTEQSGLTIADDDLSGFGNASLQDDDDDGPTVAGQTESKRNKWKTVGAPAPSSKEQEDADRIIAAAAEETAQSKREADDAPVVEDLEGLGIEDAAGLVGLRTGAEVSAHIRRKQRAERKKYEEEEKAGLGGGKGETIYRDASGRVINVAMKRAEARKKAEEEERKKREEEEAARGDVQRVAKAERQQALQDAKYLTVARGADDVEMNEELKERERWNDPAANFVEKKKKGRSKSGRPLYQGAHEPNRYGIRPGHRWDGVDRGVGFEKKWFAARNRQRDRQEMEYAWQMDE